jgi:uncharacterized protein (DUF302 family)
MTRSDANTLCYELTLSMPYDRAVEHVSAELKKEGFGILTRIDVDSTFKEKLGKEFRRYVILGACNPPLAHRALSARPEAGMLLPCNVTVDEVEPGTCHVRIVNAGEMMKIGGFENDPEIAAVGAEADERLRRVAAALRS